MTPELWHLKDLFADFDRPWFVAGGWAIDLWLGRITREHSDIDIAILRADQQVMRESFVGWEFEYVVGGIPVDWSDDVRLVAPIHEVRACHPVRDLRLEFLLNESSKEKWIYRRNSAITLPVEMIGCKTADGIPFLNPEIVLLYKSKQPMEKDHDDFDAALGRMERSARGWLKAAIQRCNAKHPWIKRF